MKLLAFIKKDILVTLSYRFRLLLDLGNSIISLLIFYFIGRTFSGAISPFLEPYGNDFFLCSGRYSDGQFRHYRTQCFRR